METLMIDKVKHPVSPKRYILDCRHICVEGVSSELVVGEPGEKAARCDGEPNE